MLRLTQILTYIRKWMLVIVRTIGGAETAHHTSFAEKVAKASLTGRLALTWPLILAMSWGVIASIGYIDLAEQDAQTRAFELQRLARALPNDETVKSLKRDVGQLRTFIPQEVLAPLKACTSVGAEQGQLKMVCTEMPSFAGAALAQINSTIDQLDTSALESQDALRRIRLISSRVFGVAFADDDAFPSDRDKSFMLHTVFAAIVIMTVGCFFTMLLSKNSRAVTYSIDALKFFGGLYAGIIGSVFGIKK